MVTPNSDWEPIFRTSPFLDLIGPLYSQGAGADLRIGFRAAEKHCNARGTVHGGVLSTVADIALGYTAAFSVEPSAALTTVNLSLDFSGAAYLGDWLETGVEIQHLGSRSAFANGYVCVGDKRIVRISAVFIRNQGRMPG